MPYPDDFNTADLFPSTQSLLDEARDRLAIRLGTALGRIDSAMNKLQFRIGALASTEDTASHADVVDAEVVARELELTLVRISIASNERVTL